MLCPNPQMKAGSRMAKALEPVRRCRNGIANNRKMNSSEVAASRLVASGDNHGSAVLATLVYLISCGAQDRKSTRLNSSHVRISYAVFCLKKKKKQQTWNK